MSAKNTLHTLLDKTTWTTATLGEVCKVDWGNTKITKKSYIKSGLFPAVSAAGCDGRLNHYEHEVGTLVVSAIGTCGNVFYPESNFTAIKNTITLTPHDDNDNAVIGKFLYYLLSYVELPKRGAVQHFITKNDVQNFTIPLPPRKTAEISHFS